MSTTAPHDPQALLAIFSGEIFNEMTTDEVATHLWGHDRLIVASAGRELLRRDPVGARALIMRALESAPLGLDLFPLAAEFAPTDPVVLGLTVRALDGGNACGVSSAAMHLGRARHLPAVPALIARLNHEDPMVRFYVIRALEKMRDPRAIPAIEKLVGDWGYFSKGRTVAFAAQRALKVLRGDHDPHARGGQSK